MKIFFFEDNTKGARSNVRPDCVKVAKCNNYVSTSKFFHLTSWSGLKFFWHFMHRTT